MFTAILGTLYVLRPVIGFMTKWGLVLATAFFAFQIVMIPFNGVAGLFGKRITSEYVDSDLFNSQIDLIRLDQSAEQGDFADQSVLVVKGLIKNNSKWPITNVVVGCRVQDPNQGVDSRTYSGSDKIAVPPGKIEFFMVRINQVHSKPRNGGLRGYFCRLDHADM